MSRISKVTTKTGDKGDTGLGDGSRVSKSHSLVWFLGEVDSMKNFPHWMNSFYQEEMNFAQKFMF